MGPAGNKIAGWLYRGAERDPGKVLVHSIEQKKSITWGEMAGITRRIGQYLAARDIGANDRIVLLSGNSIEHLAVYIGVMAYGATICTIQVEMNAAHLGEIFAAIAPKHIIAESGVDLGDTEYIDLGEWKPEGGSGFFNHIAGLEDRLPEPVNTETDIASIFYTSGTTSKPKGILCSFHDLCQSVEGTAAVFTLGPEDRILDYRSFNWMSAQTLSGLGALFTGATLLLAAKFSQSRFFDWIAQYGATIAAGNPTVINMLINRPVEVSRDELKALRFITSSSAPLLISDWDKFEAMYNIPVAQGFGTSETGWIAGANETNRRIGSVGKPIPYQNVRIVDEDGAPLSPGETGHIELGDADPNGARRFAYLGEDGAPRVNATGRATTGDLGHLDGDGYLFVSGREKDLIIRGGVNISPVEIDNVITGLAGIAEAAVIGIPDAIYGEEVIAYVVAEAGTELAAEDVIARLAEQLPEPKRPKAIHIRDALPKSERGKLDRQALRDSWEAAFG
jgi:acyl-coenzyme A synthetase/AMP-(fatty) acid ligase